MSVLRLNMGLMGLGLRLILRVDSRAYNPLEIRIGVGPLVDGLFLLMLLLRLRLL
jgi:hypothetical protein